MSSIFFSLMIKCEVWSTENEGFDGVREVGFLDVELWWISW